MSDPFKPKKPRRLEPMNERVTPLMGLTIEQITVGSWCPNQEGEGKPTAVSVSFKISGLPDLHLRIKSPERVDEIVQMLLRHRRDVWPDAP